MKKLSLFLSIFLISILSVAWTIKESKQDEDFKIIVNDGGVFKEALTVVGSTGAVKVGADGFDVTAGGTATLTTTGLVKPSYNLNGTSQLSFSNSDLVRSGTYTPTTTAISNLDSNPTVDANSMIWTQVGRVVTVSGYMGVNPTTINTATLFRVTLPVLPTSNFTTTTEVAGAGTFLSSGLGSSGTPATVSASTGSKLADLAFYATDVTIGRNFFYQFQYLVN
jgi:hypothetical protein